MDPWLTYLYAFFEVWLSHDQYHETQPKNAKHLIIPRHTHAKYWNSMKLFLSRIDGTIYAFFSSSFYFNYLTSIACQMNWNDLISSLELGSSNAWILVIGSQCLEAQIFLNLPTLWSIESVECRPLMTLILTSTSTWTTSSCFFFEAVLWIKKTKSSRMHFEV